MKLHCEIIGTSRDEDCKRRNELRDYKRCFANDRRSIRNGIRIMKNLMHIL